MARSMKTRPSGGEMLPETTESLAKTVSSAEPSLGKTRMIDGGGFGETRLLFEGSVDMAPDSGQQLVQSGASTQAIRGEELPPDAPEWMRVGRLLALKIEDAIASGDDSSTTRSAIARAWAAFQLGGYDPRYIKKVATIAMQAHAVMRDSNRADRAAIVDDCTTIVKNGLPPDVVKWLPRERIRDAVQKLADCDDPRRARLLAVAALLGWSDAAVAWGTEAIAIALDETE